MSAGNAFRLAVYAALGNAPDVIEPGKMHRFGTTAKRGDDAGWCKLFADGRAGIFGCWRAGVSEVWTSGDELTRSQRAEIARHLAVAVAERERARRRQWEDNASSVRALWSQCTPVSSGDPVALYLEQRGLGDALPLPACVRLHPRLPYWHQGRHIGSFPAMVAEVRAPDGHVVTLHRTYLTDDGQKAAVPAVRKLMSPGGPLRGACVALFKPKTGMLGVAEGIETALAATLASGVPTVAAYCADNLTAWQWPKGVRRVVVFADNDEAGQKAAGGLQRRALSAGLACIAQTPTEAGADWADVWAKRELTTEVQQ